MENDDHHIDASLRESFKSNLGISAKSYRYRFVEKAEEESEVTRLLIDQATRFVYDYHRQNRHVYWPNAK